MMETTRELIQELTGIAENPGAAVRDAMQQTGKKAVGCFPIYAPEELVYAAGMLPVGMWGGNTKGNLSGKYLQSFCCSIMKANTEQALRGDYDVLSAVIMTAYCDTLKCLMENWKVALPQMKILPIVYAQNRKSESGRQYMKEEFLRLKKELEAVAGTEITDEALEDALDVYDDYRSVMQDFIRIVPDYPALFSPMVRHLVIKAAYFMDKKVYTEKVRKLLGSLPAPETKPRSLHPVILTGLLGEPLEFLDLLEENEFQVVADDLAQESRQFRTIGDRSLPPLERMELTASTFIYIPVMFPLIQAVGIDPVQFGVIAMLNMTLGLLTPPLGINLFLANGLDKRTDFNGICKTVFPMFLLLVFVLLLVTYIPGISTGLLHLWGSAGAA